MFIPWHFPLHNDNSITGASVIAEKEFKKQYPAIYNYLLFYKEKLSQRNKVETCIRYEWYALQRWGANYWEDFFKQKIVWKRIGSKIRFSYVKDDCFALDSTVIATGKRIKYITALLNSKLLIRELLNNSPKTGTGDVIISVQALTPLKVYIPTQNEEDVINELIDIIVNKQAKGIETNIEEEKIDKLVYKFYGLNQPEIEFIESNL